MTFHPVESMDQIITLSLNDGISDKPKRA